MVDKISEKSALEIWRLGIRLSHARDVFGGTRATAKIKNKAKQDANATTLLMKSAVQKLGAEWLPSFDGVGSDIASLKEKSASEIAKVQRLFERLQTGDLVAVGFPVHESDASTPVQVPPFMLERRFAKWGQDSLVGLRRHYARVVVSEFLIEPVATGLRETPKRVGAPSFDQNLEVIAAELSSRGVSLAPRPRKILYAQMRSLGVEMKLLRFDETHPDDETIRRFFAKRAATKSDLKTQ